MANFSIRRAKKNEAEAVAELWLAFLNEQEAVDDRFRVADDARERWRNDYPLWLEDDTRRLCIAEQDEEVVGFISAHRWGPPPVYAESEEVYIDELYVTPDYRKQGVGTALVAFIRRWAEELYADRLRFISLSSNETAHAFWQTHRAAAFYTTMTIELERNTEKGEAQKHKRSRLGF